MPKCSRCSKIKKYYEDKDICYPCARVVLPDILEEKIIPEILDRSELLIYSSAGLVHFNKICKKWGAKGDLKHYLLKLYIKPKEGSGWWTNY